MLSMLPMPSVETSRDLVRNVSLLVVTLAVVLPAVWAATSFGKLAMLGVVGIVGLVVAVYVGLRHPLWFLWALAFVVAALPFSRVPGVGVPIWYLLAFGAIVAALLHPRLARSPHPLELAMWAVFFTFAVALVVTMESVADISAFVRYCFGALLLFPLVWIGPAHAATFGKIYAVSTAVNGAYGIFVLAVDPGYSTLAYLRAFGYSPEVLVARVAYAGDNVATSIRLGGTWVEPNAAGLALALGLALATLLFTGWRRVALVVVMSLALVLTLSRATIFTIIAGVLLVLLFHPMRARARSALLGLLAVGAVAALSAEPVRRRLLSSFGSGDAGSAARADALRVFPDRMSGHWIFGAGWARREFLDPAYSYVFNLPSNAPLVVLYRSGFIAFAAFMALALIGCVCAYHAVRSESFPRAMYGGFFIGLVVVAMQLDHPLGGTPVGAMTFAIALAFMVHVDRARRAGAPDALGQSSAQAPDPTSVALAATPSNAPIGPVRLR